MKSNIFMPNLLKVGFQKREDTYTQQLAYITYFDEEGTLKKERSWNGWRDEKIDPLEIENVPTSGFVLNKQVGNYSSGWNHRQAYIRIYDPRGFEFEITLENLLYILENTNCIKGKGLEGEFVYGWSGTNLVLIPTSSPDYKELQAYKEAIYNKKTYKAKDLVAGTTYLTKKNETFIYLGKFDYYDHYDDYHSEKKGKKLFFLHVSEKDPNGTYVTLSSLGQKIIGVVDEECAADFAEIMDKLERQRFFSPLDKNKDEYIEYTLEEFLHDAKKARRWFYCFTKHERKIEVYQPRSEQEGDIYYARFDDDYTRIMEGTLKEIYTQLKPKHVKRYLKNGKLYQSRC